MRWPIKIIGFMLFLTACSSGPESIEYGKDACDFCRMTIVDPKFGGEIITKKGKVYKFDATECMANYYLTHSSDTGQFASIVVIDYGNPGKMIEVHDAFFTENNKIKSPMGAHLAAFKNRQAARQAFTGNGKLMSWGELLKSMPELGIQ